MASGRVLALSRVNGRRVHAGPGLTSSYEVSFEVEALDLVTVRLCRERNIRSHFEKF